jgi:hypothetical protein
MKLTVITGHKGQLVAMVHAHLSEHNRNKDYKNGPHATLRPLQGHKFHEIELPEECSKLTATERGKKALAQIKKKKR